MQQFGLEYAAAFEADASRTAALRSIILKHYYSDASPEWLAGEVAKDGVNYEAVLRYTNACRWVVPWVLQKVALQDINIVDIGAGTGATAAAFAHVSRSVQGYEIEPKSVAAGNERFMSMGIKNAAIKLTTPADLLTTAIADHQDGAQVVMLFAVLEHLTQPERQIYLSTIWNELLRPGGYLIVVDTPNRLAMFDAHTSQLPFFHLLPEELALRYVDRSKRFEFVDGMRKMPEDRAVEALHRWGLGVSYHDFEVGFGRSLDGIIASGGFEWEMTNWFPPNIDDEIMVRYFLEKQVPADLGFARFVINMIFRKPIGDSDRVYPAVPADHLSALVQHCNLDPRLTGAIRNSA